MSNRTSLRMRVLPRFPARITGTNGLAVIQDNLDLVITPDFGSLVQVPSVSDPTKTFFWGWNSDLNYYSIISFENIVSNIQDVIIGPTTAAMELTSPTTDQFIYFTGADVAATTSLTAAGRALLDDADATAQRATLGLGGGAVLNVGTTAGTVAAGDDSRITGAAQKASNLSDLANAGTARTNLGLGGAAVLGVGTTAGTVAAGDDSRMVNAVQTSRTLTAGTGIATIGDLSANRTVALNAASIASLLKADTSQQYAALAASADVNSQTAPGIYTVTTPVNGPYSTYTGAWQLEVGVIGGQGVQRMWPRINPGFIWVRNYEAAWSAWAPLSGEVSPEHYGATGVYSSGVDDTVALSTAINSGFKVKLVGTYNLTSKISCGFGFGAKDVCVQGMGREHLIVRGVSGGISFFTGSVTTQATLRCIFRDFVMICSVTSHTGIAIEVAGVTAQGSGATVKNYEIENIQLFASADTNGFAKGVSLNNARNGTVRGCTWQGVRTQTPGARAGIGFEAYGNADPVDMTFDDCEAYFGVRGFSITGTCEGARLTNSTAVMCDRGLHAEVDENPISGTNTGKQLIMVSNCHFNCFSYGMYINRVWDVLLENNDILFEAANSNCQGLYLGMAGDLQLRARVNNLSIFDRTTASPSIGSTIGINVENLNIALGTMVRITGTIFDNLKFGLYAQANTNDIKYDVNSCIFTACTNNLGGNTPGITGY